MGVIARFFYYHLFELMSRSEKNENAEPVGSRISRWWYALLIIPLIVYLKGLAPSVVLGDTGDFQTAGWIWGVAHPPGYPLYTVLVGIIEHLPIPPLMIGSGQLDEFSAPAWRSNLLSALFALVKRLTGKPVAALIAAGALAFSRAFWWHAEICENDTLSSLFILGILLMAVRLVQDRKPGDPYWMALLMGLAVSHHQSILMFFPAVFIYLLVNKTIAFNFRKWILCALLFVVGLAPFFYLPAVKYRNPDGPLNFVSEREYAELFDESGRRIVPGRYTTESQAEYFFNYIGRTIYSHQRKYTHTAEALGDDVTTTPDVFLFYTDLNIRDFGYLLSSIGLIGFLLSFVGLAGFALGRGKKQSSNRTIKNQSDIYLLLFISFIVYFLVMHFYPSGDILRAPSYNLETAGPGLMLPLELIWAAFIGLGIGGLIDAIEKTGIPGFRLETIALIIGIIAIAFAALGNYSDCDKSRNTLAHEYGMNALDSCPENSTLVVAGDELYAFWYLHNVHPDPATREPGYRRDINLTTWSGELESLSELSDVGGAMISAVVRLSEENPGSEIDLTFFNSRFPEEPALRNYSLARRGILFAFTPPGDTGGLTQTADELADQSGIYFFEAGLPDKYNWNYWGGNGIVNDLPLRESGRWLWPPEADIRWRIGEMLVFYGTDALLKGDTESARGYFRQWALVEPENPEARNHLELAGSGK